MIRIGSDTDTGMNRNSSERLGMNSYPILSAGMVRMSSTAPVPMDNFQPNTFQSRASGRQFVCQYYASTAPALQILLRYWRSTKPVVNFHLGTSQQNMTYVFMEWDILSTK